MARPYSANINLDQASSRWRLDSGDALSLLILWIGVYLLFWRALDAGEFWWTDESRHAMNGVFFLDLWRDLPFQKPYEYALQYFAQYPALALNWYPPFFPVVESVFFALFGITESAGRMTVLMFALAGATAWYCWARPIWGRQAAALSCLLYLSAPGVVDWTRSVMLEVPAIAMIIIGIWAFEHYLNQPSFRRAAVAGLSLGCMLLLKQTTVFILPALIAYALLTGRARLLWRREAAIAYVMVGIVGLALALHAMKFGAVPVNALADQFGSNRAQLFSLRRWIHFWLALWDVSGPALGIASLAGILFRLRVKGAPQDLLLFLWVAASYLFTTVVVGSGEGNVPRYTMYALPALALLACMPLSRGILNNSTIRLIAFVPLAMLAGWNVYATSVKPHPYVSGYERAAEFVARQEDPGMILFAGKHDGNFIFHLRALDPEKNKAVLRADKILVSMSVHKAFGMVSYVESVEDVIALIDRFGVGLVVIESRDVVDFPEFKLLAKAVGDPRFRLINETPVLTNVPEFAGLSVKVYRYLDKKEQAGDLVIPMPHMGIEIKLKAKPGASG